MGKLEFDYTKYRVPTDGAFSLADFSTDDTQSLDEDRDKDDAKKQLDDNQERLNELKLWTAGQAKGREGFKTITAGPDHPGYEAFCPAPGHQLGFNDMKTIEVRDLLLGLAGENPPWPDFREAWEIQRVVDAVVVSATEGRWVTIAEV